MKNKIFNNTMTVIFITGMIYIFGSLWYCLKNSLMEYWVIHLLIGVTLTILGSIKKNH